MANYYQPEIETMPYEQLRQLQSERLVKQVKHVWDHVPYYRAKMQEKGLTPDDIKGIEDLHKLPFLKKDDLREAYPYGLLGKPLSECVRIHSTSGTTGKRVVAFYTQHDVDLWDDCCARAIVAAGGTSEDVCHVAYGFGLFTGGLPDPAYEFRQYRPPAPVHGGPGFYHYLLHTFLCAVPGRVHPGAGDAGPD